MTRNFVYISVIASTAALTYGLAANDYIPVSITVALLGIAWIVLFMRGLHRFSGFAFAVIIVISLASLWADVSPGPALAGVIFSLLAWDLTKFFQRLQMTDSPQDAGKTERAHFVRLALVIGLSLAGYFAATRIHVTLTFGAAALLALLGIWGISALVYRLRSRE
ncbi:MAG: hypothetical protein QY332_18315 [Anaerolineales bacterium]|nr:MAG: hypothetical protein QY332_18315 [Anaerolineales bacterium]